MPGNLIYYALVLIVIALVAAFLGFGGVAGTAMGGRTCSFGSRSSSSLSGLCSPSFAELKLGATRAPNRGRSREFGGLSGSLAGWRSRRGPETGRSGAWVEARSLLAWGVRGAIGRPVGRWSFRTDYGAG